MYNIDMKFPQDSLRFLYWVFFKPLSLRALISQLDPTLQNVATLLARAYTPSVQSLKILLLFYILIVPWILGIGTGVILDQLDMNVNWLKLTFYLLMAIMLSSTFYLDFCIAFLLPFSIVVAIWSSTSFSLPLGILFSLTLGLAYGLSSNSARWGLSAGLVYGVLLSFILGYKSGLLIGAAFLIGYFRIIFYIVEAPLSWGLAIFASRGDALQSWQFHPVRWDELIWFPLPWLDRHLLAIKEQNGTAFQAAMLEVKESFGQRWAIEQIQD